MLHLKPVGQFVFATCKRSSLPAISLLVLFALSTLGCTLSQVGSADFQGDPQAVVSSEYACPNGDGASVFETRPWKRGVVVVYEVRCDNSEHLSGHSIFRQVRDGWKLIDRKTSNVSTEEFSTTGTLVDYYFSGIDDFSVSFVDQLQEFIPHSLRRERVRPKHYYGVYGRILSPEVAAVEATFDNGETLRDEGNGRMFALTSFRAAEIWEFKVLDANDQVLQRDSSLIQLIGAEEQSPCSR
jgi:hypothetical protein